ncbi:hypothetical protein T492DRAFT_838021 [Pavlovales sp. CCMP2436]|nr:hypothetical protein T492DRAFT_838021 [Pavlovales sp. CCMP2436]
MTTPAGSRSYQRTEPPLAATPPKYYGTPRGPTYRAINLGLGPRDFAQTEPRCGSERLRPLTVVPTSYGRPGGGSLSVQSSFFENASSLQSTSYLSSFYGSSGSSLQRVSSLVERANKTAQEAMFLLHSAAAQQTVPLPQSPVRRARTSVPRTWRTSAEDGPNLGWGAAPDGLVDFEDELDSVGVLLEVTGNK